MISNNFSKLSMIKPFTRKFKLFSGDGKRKGEDLRLFDICNKYLGHNVHS